MQQQIQDYLNKELNQKIKISINRLDISRTNRFQSEIKALEQKLYKLPNSTNIKINDPSDSQFVSLQVGNERQHLSLPKQQNIRYLMDTKQKGWPDNINITNEKDPEIKKYIYKGKFPFSNYSVKRLNLLASQELSQLANEQDQGTQYLVRGKQLDFSSEASYSNLKSIFSVSKGYNNIEEKEPSTNTFEFPPIKTPQLVEPKLFSCFEKKSYRSSSEQQKLPPQSSTTPYQFQPIVEVKERSRKNNDYIDIKNLRKRCEVVLQNSPNSTRSPVLSPLPFKNSQKTPKIIQSLQDRFGKLDFPLSMNRIVQLPGPADYDGDYYSMNRKAQKHRDNSTYKRQLQDWLQNYDK